MPTATPATTPAPTLEAAIGSHRYGDVTALRDVLVRVSAGRVGAVLGPSGSGKSTLLRLVAGLEPLTDGRVAIGGRDVGRLPSHRRGVGLVFQDHALFPHLDVRDNVAFGLIEARWPARRRRERVETLLSELGLAGLGGRRVDALSGGERQRVALARALAPQPAVLLLDEPFASLDRSLRERLADDLAERLHRGDLASLLVTHDLDEAAVVADEVVVLRDGRLVQTGTVDALLRTPVDAWLARFVGHPNVYGAEAPTHLPRRPGEALWLRDEHTHLSATGDGAEVDVRRVRVVRGGLRVDLWAPDWGVAIVWRGAERELDRPPRAGERWRLHAGERAWGTLPDDRPTTAADASTRTERA